jgi:hypothetical protein
MLRTPGWSPGFLNPPLLCCSAFLSAGFGMGSKVAANRLAQQKPFFALRNAILRLCKNWLPAAPRPSSPEPA